MKLLQSLRNRPRRALQYIALAVLAVAAIVRVLLPDGRVEDVEGRARAIDGDSLRVAGREVRLDGIDAPEGPQICRRDGQEWACGREATRVLGGLIAKGDVVCNGLEIDKHGRLLALCRSGGADLNREMVRRGYAISYGRFRAEEKAAKTAGLGLWSGEFETPRQWRNDRNIGR